MKSRKFINALRSSLFVLFTILFFSGKSQVFYSTDKDYFKLKQEANNVLSHYSSNYPDTNSSNFHNFFPRNFSGNIGLPSPEYILGYGTADPGFRLYSTPYKNDLFSEEQIEYYRTKGPFANLTGVSGSKKLQILKLFFTHTYRDKINIGIKFNRYTSQGFYLKQQTYTNNLFVTSNYTNRKQSWGYYFYFLNNSNKNQENGGIVGDTLSDKDLLKGKDLLPVKISSAARSNKEYKALFNPWFKLNGDSGATLNHFIQLKSRFNFAIYKYDDANIRTDKFYTLMYLDTAKTKDSTRVMQVINEVSYALKSSNNNFGMAAGYRNEINSVWQKADSSFLNHILISDLRYGKTFFTLDSIPLKKTQFNLLVGGRYIAAGANAGNYKLESRSEFVIYKKKSHSFFLNLLQESRNPDYIYNYWVSNNFIWFNNGYKPQQTSQVFAGYKYNKSIGVSVLFQDISNYLFFDHVAFPRQYAGRLQNVAVHLDYSVVLFKHLGFSVNEIFQNTSNTSYISIPQTISTAKLFYTGNLYKNNLQLQTGVQLQYYQSFYGYAYMPATQVFYLQDRQTTGEYPFVDVYLNARIRPVNVFVKVENVLYGYAGKNYSFVPGYYQSDRAFRFGISWMFFD